MTLTLRPYQHEAIEAVEKAWADDTNRPAVALPTGTGKTLILASLAAREADAGGRAVILVHRDELLRQTIDKLGHVAPELKVGVVQGNRQERDADVVVASIATLSREKRLAGVDPAQWSLVICDEAHHAAAPGWRRVLEHTGCMDGLTRAVGLSATLWRDSGGLGDIWQDVVYRCDILSMIRAGYLVDAIGRRVTVAGLDLGRVRSTAGDFADGELGQAMLRADVPEAVVGAYLEHALRPDGTPRPGISFAPTVEVAETITDALCRAGIPAATIVGTTEHHDRQRAYAQIVTGELAVLSSVSVLTEGFDLPAVEVVVNARPTRSAGLYVQMVGRALRPSPETGKTAALVLDISGASSRHRVATLVALTSDDGTVPEPVRQDVGEGLSLQALAPMDPVLGIEGEYLDLFDTSDSAWCQTIEGTWLIPTRTGLVALWPAWDVSPEHWSVMYLPDLFSTRGVRKITDLPSSLPLAMAAAEQFATELDPTVSSRSAAWRSKRPSDKTAVMAERMGVPLLDDQGRARRAGAISADIAALSASCFLDPKLEKYRAKRGIGNAVTV